VFGVGLFAATAYVMPLTRTVVVMHVTRATAGREPRILRKGPPLREDLIGGKGEHIMNAYESTGP